MNQIETFESASNNRGKSIAQRSICVEIEAFQRGSLIYLSLVRCSEIDLPTIEVTELSLQLGDELDRLTDVNLPVTKEIDLVLLLVPSVRSSVGDMADQFANTFERKGRKERNPVDSSVHQLLLYAIEAVSSQPENSFRLAIGVQGRVLLVPDHAEVGDMVFQSEGSPALLLARRNEGVVGRVVELFDPNYSSNSDEFRNSNRRVKSDLKVDLLTLQRLCLVSATAVDPSTALLPQDSGVEQNGVEKLLDVGKSWWKKTLPTLLKEKEKPGLSAKDREAEEKQFAEQQKQAKERDAQMDAYIQNMARGRQGVRGSRLKSAQDILRRKSGFR